LLAMATVAQPVGWVTLVFTDIEGSTRLVRELGEGAYRQVLTEHRVRVRAAFGARGGYEVDSQGDSFFFAFASATNAMEAIGEALASLEGGPIRIRVGVHSGEPALDPPRYVGVDVHKAARVMAAGHGGQVLLSEATREALADDHNVRFLGEYRLKDFAAPERLYQLGAGEFPPLRTLYHTNLPVSATSFIGREQELKELIQRLSTGVRLLTLTGPGGVGKTRLALEAAAAVSEEFPDGVWWVPLAPLRDSGLILNEIVRILDIDQPGRDLAELFREVFAGKQMLLLLDNAEHLLPEAASPLALLRDTGGPSLFVTSRERLQLAGEYVYEVPPLAEDDGLALFAARAEGVNPGAASDPAVERLCARLDYLPLALELAAARTGALSATQILQRVSQQPGLLRSGRDADPRQQTLRSTIAWSYDLLEPDEQEFFARLAVFAGGCTLEAAEEICDADLDALVALVEKSLVRRTGERYWMLETIREYAAERLATSEKSDELRLRHVAFFERFAAEAEAGMRTASVGEWFDRVALELPNVREAIELSLRHDEADAALRVATNLFRFWAARDLREGRAWLERALATDAGTLAERGTGSLTAGACAFFQGDLEHALTRYREAIDLAIRAGDVGTHARALGLCGSVLSEQGNLGEARAMVHECRKLAPGIEDPWTRAHALFGAPAALSFTGDVEEAEALYRELIATMRELGDEQSVAVLLNGAGYAAILRGSYDDAAPLLEESLDIGRRLRDAFRITVALGNLGLIAVSQGRYGDAVPLFDEALRLAASRGDRRLGSGALLGLAAAHAALGHVELAVELDTVATAVLTTTGIVEPPAVIERLQPHLRAAREHADPKIAERLAALPLTMDTAITVLERWTEELESAAPARVMF
jgi:predicted ATPase/class 3 adenylate cyclase